MPTINDFYLRDIKHRDDFEITESGNFVLEDGLDNIKNQLYRRLITVPGAIIHRPDYGVGIKRFQNATMTFAQKQELATRIQEQFEADDRVSSVTGVSIKNSDNEPEKFIVSIRVELVGFGETDIQYTPFEV